MDPAAAFFLARDFLLAHRDDYRAAYDGFRWPALEHFNWALDYFDAHAHDNDRPALWVVDGGGETRLTFAALSERSARVANFLRRLGVRRGDRVLVMLPAGVPLWEVTLAVMKLGAVLSPATPLLGRADLRDRVERGGLSHVVADPAGAEKLADVSGALTRVVAGGPVPGWVPYEDAAAAPARFEPDAPTRADDPFLLYFTSGTTARPKLVLHTHRSYPVGHLSTLYWIGLRAGDVHLNISSPGWAKHAWSSVFAPWNAGATVFSHQLPRFDARQTLAALARYPVTTLCAPPTVWRLLVLEDLRAYPVRLRELVSAGEPLNPEVIEKVRRAWGLTVRDGYGQTETTALLGNPPGQPIQPGSVGRPLPGYQVELLDPAGRPAGDEGELTVCLRPRPAGLMAGYLDGPGNAATFPGDDYYRTADVFRRDASGNFWYVGRSDDVFKSSDYRISPFELESALLEHPAVAEAAVVPSPDPIRLSVPKAFVVLKPGVAPTAETARDLFLFLRNRLALFQRVRRLEFAALPKTASGKIRRGQLRAAEAERRTRPERGPDEFWEEDFPGLK